MIIQELIKDLLVAIADAGLRIKAYSTINSIALYVAIVIGIVHGRKLKSSWAIVLISIGIERTVSGPLATAVLYVTNGFTNTGEANAVVAFAFVPLIGFLISKLLRKPYIEIWDIVMVGPLIMFAGARIACTIAGCCRGYPCDWGIYNVKTGEYVFPIQLLESLVTIVILICVFRREKRNNYVSDGRNVPICLVSYGIARFFLEFLHDNKKIVAGLASTQFHCLIMIFVGIITLLIIRKTEKVNERLAAVTMFQS